MVNRAFKKMDKEEFLVIYKSSIRTHLGYCVQSWNPEMKKYWRRSRKGQRGVLKAEAQA